MAFPATPLDIEVSVVLDADLSVDPGTWSFTDITDFVHEDKKIVIRRGKTGKFTLVTASRCTMTVDNSDGRFSRHNPSGTWYGRIKKNTPLRVRVNNGSGYVNRFCGYVTGWPPSWDPSESDQTVSLSADGIMRRLGRDPSIHSPLYRSMIGAAAGDVVPAEYWPMEDGSEATLFVSAVGGTSASGVITGDATELPVPAGHSGITGSSTSVRLPANAVIVLPVRAYEDTGQWVAQTAMSLGIDGFDFEAHLSNGTRITAVVGLGDLQVTVEDSTGSVTYSNFDAIVGESSEVPLSLTIALTDAASGTLTSRVLDGDGTIVAELTTTGVGYSTVDRLVIDNGLEENGVSHVGLFTDPAFDPDVDIVGCARATSGWVGEQAHERVQRLCQEEGIPVTITGDSSAAMGPQRTARTLDLLRDCSTADQGILYEPLDFGLAYITVGRLFNQIPAITLAYDQGHITPPFIPDDDDRDFYNDVTATRPNGSPMRYRNAESVADVGSYPFPIAPTVETDDQAYNVASWLANVGSNDELQWPAVKPNLRRAPELIDAWMAADIGDNLSITGHPSPLASNDIVQLILGYTEILGPYTFEPTVTLSPATIYNSVGVWGLMGQELHAAINTSVASADIATTSGPVLATSLGSGGYTAKINGEEIQVTAVAASTITFGTTGTVTHANNANVTPGIPASVATGDLLLCFAAIRNSGTGVPNTPAGYTRLAAFGSSDNCQLFAKIATSGAEAAPTVSFTGGVAGADTSAQMIRLAGKWHSTSNILLDSNTQLNPSAQNINYPGLMVPLADDCIILHLVWKADDWTSVTGPGTEISEPDTTTGDDQGIAWYYTIQTTAAAVAPGAVVVTGGTAAISRSAVVALRCDYQTATITRSVNGVSASHSAGDAVTLARPSRWALV